MDQEQPLSINRITMTVRSQAILPIEERNLYYDQDVDLHMQSEVEIWPVVSFTNTTELQEHDASVQFSKDVTCFASTLLILPALVSFVCVMLALIRAKGKNTKRNISQARRKEKHTMPVSMNLKHLSTKKAGSIEANGGDTSESSLQEWEEAVVCAEKKSESDDNDNDQFPFNLFTRLTRLRTPLTVVLTVYPASRRDQKQGQGSGGRDPSHRDPSPQHSALAQPQWPPDSIHGMPWSTFGTEIHRMGTFNNLIATLPVSALKLARAGFLCLPGDAIVCYFCGLRRDEWRAGESPLDVHRQLQGTCPVVNSRGSENQAENSMKEQHMQQLLTAWSLSGPPVLPDNSLGQQTTTGEVADARGAITQPLQPLHTPTAGAARAPTGRYQTGDLAEDGHSGTPLALAGEQASASGFSPASAVASPNQTRDGRHPEASAAPLPAQTAGGSTGRQAGLMGGNAASANPGGPTPILDGTAQPESPRSTAETPRDVSRAGQQVVTYQQLGIVTDSPKRPDMAMVNSRLASFTNWPAEYSHTPLQLTEAGFFYGGYADCSRCFFCGGGLKSWDPPDNPWVEHARWFPRCAYVRQCQGQDFIDVVQELNDGRRPISFNEVRETINQRRAGGERIQEPVVDPAITSVLELGLSRETVDAAVQRLQGEGHMLTADRLYDSIQTDGATIAGGETLIPSSSDTETGEASELVAENSEMRQQRMCKICLDKESSIVFLPCGHLVSCPECSPALKHCPMCRQRVKGRVRAFPA
ncbi:E3 ubiquitin-protein ligase XIAP-like [Littorina saxatilis]|uniref:RING-type domain-containing protein n=1 Tax=Littorina saxatilis TaxID=31220 RepID=A0AAN9BKT7_9CAEN